MIRSVDFHINVKPISIDFECPYCKDKVTIPWCDLDVPDYWGDGWGEIECPSCSERIKLGDYEYD